MFRPCIDHKWHDYLLLWVQFVGSNTVGNSRLWKSRTSKEKKKKKKKKTNCVPFLILLPTYDFFKCIYLYIFCCLLTIFSNYLYIYCYLLTIFSNVFIYIYFVAYLRFFQMYLFIYILLPTYDFFKCIYLYIFCIYTTVIFVCIYFLYILCALLPFYQFSEDKISVLISFTVLSNNSS